MIYYAILLLFLLTTGCQNTPSPTPDETPYSSSPPSPEATSPTITPIALNNTTSPPPINPAPTSNPTASPTHSPSPTERPIISLIFTGQIVPGRCVQAGVESAGNADYIYDEVRNLLLEADLTVGTLNGSLSDYSPKTGCIPTFVLVGSPEHADAMAAAGFDVMSVATNHIKNCNSTTCGDRAFMETLEHLNRVGILTVGAGNNLSEAIQPIVVEVRGIRLGFVSLGQIEPLAFAGKTTPGIGILNEENLRIAIKAAKEVSDVVIVLPHWGPEYSSKPNPSQKELARLAVEAGADLVVGNHTHVIQAVQSLDGVQVFYGLGNFIFDQTWSRETQQSVILEVMFEGDSYLSHKLIPVISEQDGTVHFVDEGEAVEILERVQRASDQLK